MGKRKKWSKKGQKCKRKGKLEQKEKSEAREKRKIHVKAKESWDREQSGGVKLTYERRKKKQTKTKIDGDEIIHIKAN